MATAGMLEVARFPTLPEGELAVAFLKRHGVAAEMPDRIMATTNPHLQIAIGNIRVTAPEDQVVEARRLIAEMRAGGFAADETDYGQDEMGWAPGKVGDLDETEITGAMGGMKRAAIVVVLLVFGLPIAGCIGLMIFG